MEIVLIVLAGVAATAAVAMLAIGKLRYTFFFIDRMSGKSFEKFVAKLYEKLGFTVTLTKESGDQGIDVIVKKTFRKIGVQTKRYRSNVGNGAVQEAVAGRKYYRLDKVCVVTNRYFTKAAKELAEANKVELIDRDGLKQMIEKTRRKK